MSMQVKECRNDISTGDPEQIRGGWKPRDPPHDESHGWGPEEEGTANGDGQGGVLKGGEAGAEWGAAVQGDVRVDAEQTAVHSAGIRATI